MVPFNIRKTGEPFGHDFDGLRVIINQDKRASQVEAGRANRATAGEEIQHQVARVRRGLQDAVDHAQRFLGGIPGFLGPIGRHDMTHLIKTKTLEAHSIYYDPFALYSAIPIYGGCKLIFSIFIDEA